MKNSKKGISLIVLVITIIVIIIIAAAVILGLTKSNPINNSKIASMTNNRDSIYSTVSMYVSQITAKTQGNFSLAEIITGLEGMTASSAAGDTEDPILKAGVASSRITVGQSKYASDKSVVEPTKTNCAVENGTVPKELYKIDRDAYNLLFSDAQLASPATADSSWYIDPANGKIYLIFESEGKYPQWMMDGNNLEANMAAFTGYIGEVHPTT